jgi:hypothetical protein
MKYYLTMTLCIFLGVSVLSSCENTDRVTIDNDEDSLNLRVEYFDEDVTIEPLNPTQAKPSGIKIKLKATVSPPEVDGVTLHANHVTVDEDYAYVTYHTKGEKYCGGVEIINITDMKKPEIISQAIFNDTDATIAVRSDSKIFLGEATDSEGNESFDSPAALEVITLSDGKLTADTQRLDISSYNANDILLIGSKVCVTSGTTGGSLTIVDGDDFSVEKIIRLEGAKAIDSTEDTIIVMEGTGAKLHLYDYEYELIKEIDLGLESNYQAKAEIDILDDRVYLSAWDAGMQVYDLNSEEIVNSVLVKKDGVCNAVSVEGDYAFMANATDGVYVVEITAQDLEVVGSIKFKSNANYVAVNNNKLFVATTDGLMIFEIEN